MVAAVGDPASRRTATAKSGAILWLSAMMTFIGLALYPREGNDEASSRWPKARKR
ncbi:hypothetical protein GCM10023156_49570 [Novipirellula rosea]|uniref:Uncharacterized protein n=1 Tax=Novipirellula rosea TaxID=1031540 RepID=A0ABP8NAB2_9BACT